MKILFWTGYPNVGIILGWSDTLTHYIKRRQTPFMNGMEWNGMEWNGMESLSSSLGFHVTKGTDHKCIVECFTLELCFYGMEWYGMM